MAKRKAVSVDRPWVDGINPWLAADVKNDGPTRAATILETRKARAAELEAWQPGAGATYLAARKEQHDGTT